MEQMLLAYGLPQETIAVMMMLYKNTKIKVRSPDEDTNFFDIVSDVLQGVTLAPYQFIICLDYVLQTTINLVKENGFTRTKARNSPYSAQTNTGADYTDDIALLADTPAQVESQLHSLEKAAGGIEPHVNADKTEYICFNQNLKGLYLHTKKWVS